MAEEIARFYTRSRRFPKMIGRMTDGSRIIGGPYTLTQVGIGGVALLLLLMTRAMWATGAMLLDLAITAGITWAVTWLSGLIPITRRNLFSVLLSAVSAMFKPVTGTYKGRVPRLQRPHYVRGGVRQILLEEATEPDEPETQAHDPLEREPSSAPEPVATQHETSAPALVGTSRSGASMSAVERLLQQAKNTKEMN